MSTTPPISRSPPVWSADPDVTLDEVLAECLALLAAAPADRSSPYRLPALATLGRDGVPEVRTVVLRRAVMEGAPFLVIYADAASAKIAEIAAHSRVGLHVWDAARQQQIRLRGRAHLHAGDAAAAADWAALGPHGRALYAAETSFMVISVAVESLEWLRLTGQGGQLRARFDWQDGAARGAWRTP